MRSRCRHASAARRVGAPCGVAKTAPDRVLVAPAESSSRLYWICSAGEGRRGFAETIEVGEQKERLSRRPSVGSRLALPSLAASLLLITRPLSRQVLGAVKGSRRLKNTTESIGQVSVRPTFFSCSALFLDRRILVVAFSVRVLTPARPKWAETRTGQRVLSTAVADAERHTVL